MAAGGVEALRRDLDRIGEALSAFDAPIVDDRPGLRWVRDVLSARRDHVQQSLRDAEMTALVATLAGSTSIRWTVDLVSQLATVLQDAVDDVERRLWGEVDDAAALVLRSVTSDGASVRVVLERPEGPLEALRVEPSGRPRIDAAVEALVAGIEEAIGGEDPDGSSGPHGSSGSEPSESPGALSLAELVATRGVIATLEARCVDQPPRTVVVDQAAAARILG